MTVKNTLFSVIHDFFVIHLPLNRKCSPHTIKAYRTAVEQLVDFAAELHGCRFSSLTFDMLDFETVTAFLNHMEEIGCSVVTRNHKLKAIRALFSYAAMMDITTVAYYTEIEKIPWKKTESPGGIDFMSENAVKVLLDTPDISTKHGLRDRMIMILLYDTGARIAELLNLKICDFKLGKTPVVRLFGKGSKYRFVPIMPKTAEHIRKYLSVFHAGADEYSDRPLFYVKRKGCICPMSDDNVRKILRRYAEIAREQCPEIPENLHPHLFRHSRAMHLYQHGMDLTLVSQWLGHANLETTLIYAHADTEMKRKAIQLASAGICSIPEAVRQDECDDAELKRLYGLR